MRIRVRKEVVKCSQCRNTNDFFYLSDFSYGERLIIYDEGRKYVYINLLEDEVYNEFFELSRNVLTNSGKLIEDKIITQMFGITCDPISNCAIDFGRSKRKCYYCDSYSFEKSLSEPIEYVDVDIPIVTHEFWNKLSRKQKIEKIENELKNIRVG